MSLALEDQLASYIRIHAEDGILLDTNVLLLLLVNQIKPDLIGGKRLEAYRLEDAQILSAYVGNFSKILTTAHVLAETSNFIRQIVKGKVQAEFLALLYPIFCLNDEDALLECAIRGQDIDIKFFVRLGLTDSGLLACGNKGHLILTSDLDLHIAAASSGADSINFTHMREAAGLL